MTMTHERILILDFGSQVTQLIARRVREAHVFCEVHSCDVSDQWVRDYAANGQLKGSDAFGLPSQSMGGMPINDSR